MIHFDPPVSIASLAEVDAGSLVRWGDQAQYVGFCVAASSDPARRKGVVQYDGERDRFDWQYVDAIKVVSFGSKIVVRPDVESFFSDLAAEANGTLFSLDGAPHLIVASGNAIRFLNLTTGELQTRQGWPMMGGFRKWEAGVHGLDNHFVSVLSVSPNIDTASDDGPSEPDEV